MATEPYDVPPQDQLRLVKLPNILGVEPRPFEAESFDAGAEVEIDARGLKRVRLRDLNCIRWVRPGAACACLPAAPACGRVGDGCATLTRS